jgi:hypothetical protein
VRFPLERDLECLVIFISAMFAFSHKFILYFYILFRWVAIEIDQAFRSRVGISFTRYAFKLPRSATMVRELGVIPDGPLHAQTSPSISSNKKTSIVRTATVNYFVDRGFAPVSVNLWRSLLLVPL